ncbi:MAG: glycosyltransferase [Chitinophagaceae bacterium]
MLKILINAYACSPNMGSEPGMAWNWCVHLAKHCELYIITEGEFRDRIDAALPDLPQGSNMHFYYNPVLPKVRQMCWNQGDWRFYWHYRQWQKKTLQIAKEIVEKYPIDIVHQLNMIGFREPGYLWRMTDIPFVWGPIDAKGDFPIAYLDGAGFKDKLFIHLKNYVNKLQIRYSKRVKSAIQNTSLAISASSNSQHTLKEYYHIDSLLLNESGCNIREESSPNARLLHRDFMEIIWVGKLDFRKQLRLALRILSQTKNKNIRLHIVGGGNAEEYKKLIFALNIEEQCVWHGVLNHNAVQEKMQQSDLLLFTSVAEGTPHVVLEAIANELPVLCFDTCGQGDCVDDKVGYKISLSNPEQSIQEFADALNYLFIHRDRLKEMSAHCRKRQIELSWERKAETMASLYEKVVAE